MRKITVLFAAAAMMILVTSCGTTTVTNKPVKGGTAAPKVGKAKVGDTLSIAGNDSKLEVTLVATKRLAPLSQYGMQIHPAEYGVELRVRCVSGKVYDDSITNCVALIDRQDESHDPDFDVQGPSDGALAGQLDSVKIAPGDVRAGWIYFPIKPSVKPRILQFTANSGFADQVGEWSL